MKQKEIKYKCLKCGFYYDGDFNFKEYCCQNCGYPNDYIVHMSRLSSIDVEKELLRETEKMIGFEHSNITYEGCYGEVNTIKKILNITDYQAEMLRSWVFGVVNSL